MFAKLVKLKIYPSRAMHRPQMLREVEAPRFSRKITEWTPYKTRPVGRPRLRWMDQVEEDLKKMKIIGWRMKVEDRQEWSRIVEQTKTDSGL
jgi:hypothetical protein